MSAQDNGGPAFPQPMVENPQGGFTHPSDGYGLGGMTLRDYFAAKAMQALVTQRCYPHDQMVGTFAYMVADLMLKAREQ